MWHKHISGLSEPDSFGIHQAITKGLWVILIFIVGGIGWMAYTPLHSAIIAQGLVKVKGNHKTVQHQEGGIVKKILIHNGDTVKYGQALILLEDLRIDASVEILHDQLDSELAREARLLAEKSLASKINYPNSLLSRAKSPKTRELLATESALFNTRRNAMLTQTNLLKNQILQVDQEIKGLQHQLDAEKKSIDYSDEELKFNEPLYEKKFVAKARMLQLQRSVSDYQVRLGEHTADIAKAKQLKSELEMRIISLQNDYIKYAADDLKKSSDQLAELREKLRPTEDASIRQTITSPASGKVVGLKVFTDGAVIGPREPLMDIIPQNTSLILEAKVGLDTINDLRLGQESSIRFSAFDLRTTPMVTGKVIYISADSISDKDGAQPYYSVHILPDEKSLADAGKLNLQAGMAAEAYITTSKRTVLNYLLEPISKSLLHAFRER